MSTEQTRAVMLEEGEIYQSWLDKSTPHTALRWVVTLGLSFVYMVRVYLLQRCLRVSLGPGEMGSALWRPSLHSRPCGIPSPA
ncbi:hypothetical protein CB1_000980003 [Camelus ferus]|nr:hypothetical protein CB1_000980003 [Camelus ferus]